MRITSTHSVVFAHLTTEESLSWAKDGSDGIRFRMSVRHATRQAMNELGHNTGVVLSDGGSTLETIAPAIFG